MALNTSPTENDSDIQVPTMFYVTTSLGETPWLDGEYVLASAGTAFRNPGEGFSITIPDARELFIDSGGFQATVHFDGGYPYTPKTLFEWAESVGADYVAGMDWACETGDQLAGMYDHLQPSDVDDIPTRIERTIYTQRQQRQVYEASDWPFEFVPVVQGYEVSDYRYCARRLREEDLARPYMGIGSVCKRDRPDKIFEVLQACKDELPHSEFHLFGATRRVWSQPRFWGEFASADTHAWQLNLPDGSLTEGKEDFEPAFEGYDQTITAVQKRIRAQSSMPDSDDPGSIWDALLDGGHEGWRCGCGTDVPPYGTNFEPRCRHCRQTKLSRLDHQIALTDGATTPAETHRGGHKATTLAGFGGSGRASPNRPDSAEAGGADR